MRALFLGAIALVATAGCSGTVTGEAGAGDPTEGAAAPDAHPDGKGGGIAPDRFGEAPTRDIQKHGGAGVRFGGWPSAIAYHGGPVLLGTVNVYFIWYGNWAGDSATTVLPAFVQSLGGSPYWGINTSYYNARWQHPSNALAYKGSTTVGYTYTNNLSDQAVQAITSDAITGGSLPSDPNGVYVVLTASDVSESSGFCSKYCGWHSNATIGGADIKFAFVGNAAHCPMSCEIQQTGPNGNAGADAMASILAHEIEETVTDPDANAWYDSQIQENGDKCAWTFGTMYGAANGSQANMKLGGHDYLIQQNWLNFIGGFCALSR